MPQLPYHTIPSAPETVTGGKTIARFVDGLGFRYRWATEALRSEDVQFRPVGSSMSMMELIVHVYQMAGMLNRSFGGKPEAEPEMTSFDELRVATLQLYRNLSTHLKEMDDSELLEVRSFWNLLNGPIADSLTHVGQITSWRRINGNPQPAGVNVFYGTKQD